jgi:hypothetical protein
MVASAAWFMVGIVGASLLVLVHGASPAAWSLAMVGVPLVIGGVVQAIVAAATHLRPTGAAVDVATRARDRLGRVARSRVIVYQIATAGLWMTVAWPPADAAPPLAAVLLVLVLTVALAPLATGLAERVRQA